MFVKNPNSIKRKIVHVDDNTKNYLFSNGYSPVSKDSNGWVYLANAEITKLLDSYNGGDG